MYENSERRQGLIDRIRGILDIPETLVGDDDLLKKMKDTTVYKKIEFAMSIEAFGKELKNALPAWVTRLFKQENRV